MPLPVHLAAPLRISQRIDDFVPAGAPARVTTPEGFGQTISEYANGVIVNRSHRDGSLTVTLPENGGRTLLWGDSRGDIYWEQRTDHAFMQPGNFYNAIDDDHDGVIDRIAYGPEGGPTTVKNLTPAEAAQLQARRARSVVSQASDVKLPSINVRTFADRTEATFVLADDAAASFFPSNADRVGFGQGFLSSSSKVTTKAVANGLEVTVTDPPLLAWLNAPLALTLVDLAGNSAAVNVRTKELVCDGGPEARARSVASAGHFASALGAALLIAKDRATLTGEASLANARAMVANVTAMLDQYDHQLASPDVTRTPTTY